MSESNNETSFLYRIDRGGQIGSDIVPDGAHWKNYVLITNE